jgi:diguanylate cyclase (GGDEF)-like protein
VLKGFVALVNRRSRKLDILFRAGGEEFVLLLPDTTAPDAVKLAEALRMGVGRAGLLDDRPVTVSIGVAGLDPSDSIDSWLKNADAALYSAKKSGRNRVVAAPSSIDNHAQ